MKAEDVTTVANNSRKQAERYKSSGNFGRAFAHYLVALKLVPEWKTDLKESFSCCLCMWGENLEQQGRYKDLFNCYEQALDIFPENDEVLSNLGAHLYRSAQYREACHYFREALKVNPDCLPALRNLNSILNLFVERWHFRMLNDTHRNNAYREAILKKMNQGLKTVLDIGTGTGILSMFAVTGGAAEVYSCDYCPTMISIARKVFEANNCLGFVKLFNKFSTDLQIPADIPHRVSLVVTETLDAGLLGEGLLETLIHAWDEILLPPCIDLDAFANNRNTQHELGIVIPFGATLWAAVVEAKHIRRKTQVCSKSSCTYLSSDLSLERNEPYDTENLKAIPGGYRFLSMPWKVFKINFNNPVELKEFYRGKRDCKQKIICTESGAVDAIVVWFDLHLDEDITLSNFELDLCCWDQAIFPVSKSFLILPGTELCLSVKCRNGRLAIDMVSCVLSSNSQDSTDDLAQLLDMQLGVAAPSESDSIKVSQRMILFLNDPIAMQVMQETALILKKRPLVRILDLSPFPVAGFGLMRKNQNTQLVCRVKSCGEAELIRKVAMETGINCERIETILEESFEDFLANPKIVFFDLIITELFEVTGELNEKDINQLTQIRKVLSEDGLILPESVSVCGKLIYSEWLDRTSHVISEDLVDKYKIAQFINAYQVSYHLDLNLAELCHTCLTDAAVLSEYQLEKLDGEAIRTSTTQLAVSHSGKGNAILYWYQCHMLEGLCFDTGREDSYVNQAAILLDCPVVLEETDRVDVTTHYQNGMIKLALTKK